MLCSGCSRCQLISTHNAEHKSVATHCEAAAYTATRCQALNMASKPEYAQQQRAPDWPVTCWPDQVAVVKGEQQHTALGSWMMEHTQALRHNVSHRSRKQCATLWSNIVLACLRPQLMLGAAQPYRAMLKSLMLHTRSPWLSTSLGSQRLFVPSLVARDAAQPS